MPRLVLLGGKLFAQLGDPGEAVGGARRCGIRRGVTLEESDGLVEFLLRERERAELVGAGSAPSPTQASDQSVGVKSRTRTVLSMPMTIISGISPSAAR
jgi:hypothetical protein